MVVSIHFGFRTRHTNLSKGSEGDEVKYLQGLLNSFFTTKIIVDGVFGSNTEARIQRFQTACNIAADGIIGEETWSYLEGIVPYAKITRAILRRGSTGGQVKYLQARLNNYFGPQLIVDGLFGARTEAQVKRFQAVCQSMVDGIVAMETWRYLDRSDFDI